MHQAIKMRCPDLLISQSVNGIVTLVVGEDEHEIRFSGESCQREQGEAKENALYLLHSHVIGLRLWVQRRYCT